MGMTFFDWVWVGMTFSWLGVGECNLFLARCKWVRVSVTFFWLSVAGGWVNVTFFWLDMGERDLFLAGCRLSVGECG